MKVMFNPTEYARLLELAHLGMQVVVAHQGRATPAAKRYLALERKLYELAATLGCGELADVNSEGRLGPSAKLVENEQLDKIVSEHHNDVFWHELVARLADRDLAVEQVRHQLKADGGPALNVVERLRELEDAFWAEFEKHDLAHVVLLRGGQG